MVYMDECIRDAMNKSHLTLPMPRDPDNKESCERFVRTFNPVMGNAYRVSSRLTLEFYQNVIIALSISGSQELVRLEGVHRQGAHGALHEEVREQGREDT